MIQDAQLEDVSMNLMADLQQMPERSERRSRSHPAASPPLGCIPEQAPSDMTKLLTGVVETASQACAKALRLDVERGHEQLAGRMEALFGVFEKRMVDILTSSHQGNSPPSASPRGRGSGTPSKAPLGQVADSALWRKRRTSQSPSSQTSAGGKASAASEDKSPKRASAPVTSGNLTSLVKSLSGGKAKDKNSLNRSHAAGMEDSEHVCAQCRQTASQSAANWNAVGDSCEGPCRTNTGSSNAYSSPSNSPKRSNSPTRAPTKGTSSGSDGDRKGSKSPRWSSENPSEFGRHCPWDMKEDREPKYSSVEDQIARSWHSGLGESLMMRPKRRTSMMNFRKNLSLSELDSLNSLAILTASGLTSGQTTPAPTSPKYGSISSVAVVPEQDTLDVRQTVSGSTFKPRGTDTSISSVLLEAHMQNSNRLHVKGEFQEVLSGSSYFLQSGNVEAHQMMDRAKEVIDEGKSEAEESEDDGHRYVDKFSSEQAEDVPQDGETMVKKSVCALEKRQITKNLEEDLAKLDAEYKSNSTDENGEVHGSVRSSGKSTFAHRPMDSLREEQERNLLFSEAFSLSKVVRTQSGRLQAESPLHHSRLGWLPVLTMKVAGIIPFISPEARFSIAFFWAKNCAQICYFNMMLLLAVASFIGSIWCIVTQDGSQHKNIINTCFSMSAVIGLFSLRARDIDMLIGPRSMPLEKYAQSFNFVREWSSSSVWAFFAVATLWVCLVLARGATLHFDEEICRFFQCPTEKAFTVEDSALSFLCFSHVSCLYVMLLYTKLHIILGLEFALDAFCLRFIENGDLPRCVVDWNVVQAILRRSAHTMEACFLGMQTSALMALLVASAEAWRRAHDMCLAQWAMFLFEQIPFLLMSSSALVLFFKAAAVTEKCYRVPPLVNSQIRSPVYIDHERQYAVAYITNSAAGFYVKGVRLTAGLALKLTYLLGVLIVGLVAQILKGNDV